MYALRILVLAIQLPFLLLGVLIGLALGGLIIGIRAGAAAFEQFVATSIRVHDERKAENELLFELQRFEELQDDLDRRGVL
jgi:hypothetical protein